MCVKYILLLVTCAGAAIVPEELPSLLSVAYSNIPPVKKGTDSRVGFGFSFGNHADFQVVFELGPQSNTNPYGQPYPAGSNKRQVNNKVEKTQKKQKVPPSASDAGNYLNNWSDNMKQQKKPAKPFEPLPIPSDPTGSDETIGTIDLRKVILQDAGQGVLKQPTPQGMENFVMKRLQQLYGQKATESSDGGVELPLQNGGVPNSQNGGSIPKAPTFQRLAQFNVEEDTRSEVVKRKITEDLSDVSLDDDE